MEYLNFIFSGFCTFVGCLILISLVGVIWLKTFYILLNFILKLFRGNNSSIVTEDDKEEVEKLTQINS